MSVALVTSDHSCHWSPAGFILCVNTSLSADVSPQTQSPNIPMSSRHIYTADYWACSVTMRRTLSELGGQLILNRTLPLWAAAGLWCEGEQLPLVDICWHHLGTSGCFHQAYWSSDLLIFVSFFGTFSGFMSLLKTQTGVSDGLSFTRIRPIYFMRPANLHQSNSLIQNSKSSACETRSSGDVADRTSTSCLSDGAGSDQRARLTELITEVGRDHTARSRGPPMTRQPHSEPLVTLFSSRIYSNITCVHI